MRYFELIILLPVINSSKPPNSHVLEMKPGIEKLLQTNALTCEISDIASFDAVQTQTFFFLRYHTLFSLV